ncbi:alpha/beta fold hydrolase [Pedobacter chinensis]|uniref:Alpha/beta fold hydrolase n=1 Tax=Pedobacter chinensis TaxID=2282421 RepID=A0A369PRK2_9SPHI|nr:alpha/beta fold hydrolase [Pedobacter chinensis]RDC55164.1 alpha/beta fold hydrolase [Pedobacter chinensis]
MQQQVLFIHGGDEDGYHADLAMRDSLANELGEGFKVNYPQMPGNEDSPDFGWLDKIGTELGKLGKGAILIGHSLGGSMLLKYLSERKLLGKIAGVFLLAPPFWAGDEDWLQGLKLKKGFGAKLPKGVPFNFYHCTDDDVVSFGHLEKYRKNVADAIFIELEKGGHQFEDNMGRVAADIKNLFEQLI